MTSLGTKPNQKYEQRSNSTWNLDLTQIYKLSTNDQTQQNRIQELNYAERTSSSENIKFEKFDLDKKNLKLKS